MNTAYTSDEHKQATHVAQVRDTTGQEWLLVLVFGGRFADVGPSPMVMGEAEALLDADGKFVDDYETCTPLALFDPVGSGFTLTMHPIFDLEDN